MHRMKGTGRTRQVYGVRNMKAESLHCAHAATTVLKHAKGIAYLAVLWPWNRDSEQKSCHIGRVSTLHGDM